MNKIDSLKKIIHLFESFEIPCSLGGSGMLYFLGLQETFNDWDILTDAPLQSTINALGNIPLTVIGPRLPFASEYLIKFEFENMNFDIIGNFAMIENEVKHSFSSATYKHIDGIPISDPKQWILIYRLLNRPAKEDLLRKYFENL